MRTRRLSPQEQQGRRRLPAGAGAALPAAANEEIP
jgi:hypothetical protein